MTTRLERDLSASLMAARAKRLGKAKMNQAIERVQPGSSGALAAQVVLDGDLSGLSDAQLSTYYIEMCRSLDLNHLTRPFSLLKLNGKLIWYANKDCSDQLRKRDKVSVAIVSREEVAGVLVVTARATMPDGRSDESVGALPIDKLTGEARANALMKCETKAKRRVTLSICGLGVLDESEIEGALATERQDLHLSPHGGPGDPGNDMDEMQAQEVIAELETCKREVFDPGCSWDTMNKWRQKLGTKAEPEPFSKELSALYKSDKTTEQQRKALGSLWNSCDRKLTALEGKLKPPPIESSFVDEPDDGTEALGAPMREPGEDDE